MEWNGETRAEVVAGAEVSFAQRMPLWPMVPGLLVAAFALDFIVSWLPRGSFSRVGLIIITALLLFTAVMVCGIIVRAIYERVLPGHHRRVVTPVIRAACLTALWIPAWVLFIETSSLLMLAAGAICLLSLGYFMKLCDVEAAPTEVAEKRREPGTPFMFEGATLPRVLLPSLLLVLLLDAAIALAANYWFLTASLALGAFAGVVAWRAAMRRSAVSVAGAVAGRAGFISEGRQAAIGAAAFVFTAMALLPYLRIGALGGFRLSGPKSVAKSASGTPETQSASSEGYPGIILLPLTETQKKIVAPVKRELVPHLGVKIAEALEIPFDGQYWYFKWPEKKPRSTARVVRGSSTKTQVSSSDRYPLVMEAHQKLAQPLDLGCCNAMDLVVENADRLEGAIALELWVKKLPDAKAAVAKQRINAVAPEQAPHYLGTMVIPSSELPVAQRPNASGKVAEETLRFAIPAAMDGTQFDEITVVVRQAPERARMGAKVAVKKFVLEP